MPEECEMLNRCGFFKKYQPIKELACWGFISLYCRGPMQEACERKKYRREHGAAPSEDMLPSGNMIAAGRSVRQ